MSGSSTTDGSQLLHRAFDIVDLVTSTPGLSVRDIAVLTGIPTPSVFRIVAALVDRGLLLRHGTRLLPGPSSVPLARSFIGSVIAPWSGIGEEPLAELATTIGATSILCLPAGTQGMLVVRIDTSQSPFTYQAGSTYSIVSGAMGKALLAHQTATVRRHAIDVNEGHSYANGVRILRDELGRELQEVVAAGYSFTSGEIQPGTMGVSAPILVRGRSVASVGAALPAGALPRRRLERVVDATRKAALQVRKRMLPAHRGSPSPSPGSAEPSIESPGRTSSSVAQSPRE